MSDILDLLHIERPFTTDWDLPAYACGVRKEFVGNRARVTIGRLRSRPLNIPASRPTWLGSLVGLITR
jgi:hypothetical protein